MMNRKAIGSIEMRGLLLICLCLCFESMPDHKAVASDFSWRSQLGLTDKEFSSRLEGAARCEPAKTLWYSRELNKGLPEESRRRQISEIAWLDRKTETDGGIDRLSDFEREMLSKYETREWVGSKYFSRVDCDIDVGAGSLHTQVYAYLYEGKVYGIIVKYDINPDMYIGRKIWPIQSYDSAVYEKYGKNGGYVPAGQWSLKGDKYSIFSKYKKLISDTYYYRKMRNLSGDCLSVVSCVPVKRQYRLNEFEEGLEELDLLVRKKLGVTVSGNFWSGGAVYEIYEKKGRRSNKLIGVSADQLHFALVDEEKKALSQYRSEFLKVEALFEKHIEEESNSFEREPSTSDLLNSTE